MSGYICKQLKIEFYFNNAKPFRRGGAAATAYFETEYILLNIFYHIFLLFASAEKEL